MEALRREPELTYLERIIEILGDKWIFETAKNLGISVGRVLEEIQKVIDRPRRYDFQTIQPEKFVSAQPYEPAPTILNSFDSVPAWKQRQPKRGKFKPYYRNKKR